MKDANQKAFNNGKMSANSGIGGLTKREFFAALALQGLLANHGQRPMMSDAESAVGLADDLLLALALDENEP